MTTFASGASTKIGTIAEVTYGDTPATPSLTTQRFSSFTMSSSKEELLDPSITGSREYNYARHGNSTVEGSLTGPLAFENYDDLIASAMLNTWSGNTITIGDTTQSMTIEEAQADIAQYRSFTGVVANTFGVTSGDGLVETSFGLAGKSETINGTSLDADGYTAAATFDPFTDIDGTINEGGTVVGVVQSVDFEVSNNYTPAFIWGDTFADSQIYGRADVSGTVTVYYKDASLINKFLNETNTSLDFEVTDLVGNKMKFIFSNMKYTSAEVPVDGEGARTITMSFRALYDETDSTLKIVKTPAV